MISTGEPNTNPAHARLFEETFAVPPGAFQDLSKVWYEVWASYNRGHINEDEFWRTYLTRAGAQNIDIEKAKALSRSLTKTKPEMLALLAKLKGRARLAALSNIGREQLAFLREAFKLDNYFSPIIPSYEAGSAKPDPAIYEYALNALDTAPGDVVFIDNQQRNLPPAEAFGIKTIHFTGAAELERQLARLLSDY